MAICKTSPEIESVRGRFGGVYFKRGSASQHIQAMPRSVNYTRSGAQGGYRNAWSALAGIWGLAYVAACYVTWIAFGVTFMMLTKSGVWKHVSGWNWFTHFNVERAYKGYLPYWKALPSPDFFPPLVLALGGTKVYSQEPPLPADDPTEYYWGGDYYNGRRWYESDDKKWEIWWTGVGYVCSNHRGSWDLPHYYHVGDTPFGDYQEMGVPTPRIALATP